MKKILGGIALSALLAGPAMAADLPARMPVKAPPPVMAAVYNWSGLYVGGHAGYIWGKATVTDLDGYNGPPDFGHKPKGFLGGGHAGFNWQSGALVAGIEVEGGWMDLSGSAQYPPYIGVRTAADSVARTHDDWYAAITGRIGFAMNNILIFARGGWAVTGITNSFTDTDPVGITLVSGTSTSRRDGWTAGGGIQYGFAPNWSGRIEYAHYDFGDEIHTALGSNGGSYRFRHRLKADSVRVGLTYQFGGGAVVARY